MHNKPTKREWNRQVTRGFLYEQNRITKEYLDKKFKNYTTKEYVHGMFETYDQRAQDRMEALMEDNQHKFEMLIEAFNSKFDLFDKRLIRVERRINIIT